MNIYDLKKALFSDDKEKYEKVREIIIKKYDYLTFREWQNNIFQELGLRFTYCLNNKKEEFVECEYCNIENEFVRFEGLTECNICDECLQNYKGDENNE